MPTGTRSELRRNALLQAARGVFARQGYHQSKVSDIVEAAGAAQGTFYLYFNSKLEVLLALADEWMALVWDIMPNGDECAPQSLAEGEARAQSDLTRLFRLYGEQPEMARLMLIQGDSAAPELRQRLSEFREALADHLEQVFILRQRAGVLREFDSRVIAEGMLGFVERVAYLWCVAGQQPSQPPETLAAEVVAFMTRGMARQPGEGAGPAAAGGDRTPAMPPQDGTAL